MFDWFYKLMDGKGGFVKGKCMPRVPSLCLLNAPGLKGFEVLLFDAKAQCLGGLIFSYTVHLYTPYSDKVTSPLFRDDIVFKDPLNTFIGIDNYKSIFRALRFHGRIFFKALWLDIVSVWQPMENVVMVRWTIHGIPRVPWESRGRFDGTSEYKLDKKGKIYEHRVDNIALNSPPKFQVLAVEDLIRSVGCPSTPRPTYFEISSASPPEKT
ncbi:hypothetical protein Gotur_005747 [Gossypium turneri]